MRGVFGILVLGFSTSVLEAWTPGTDQPTTSGFTVDNFSRNDVVSFWHGVYMPSETYWQRTGWTGGYSSTAAGAEGTTSEAFVDDVERRVNFYRALCGVPSDVVVNSGASVLIETGDRYSPDGSITKGQAVQRSALMVAINSSAQALSHDPPSNLSGWTQAAWNANNKSAISKGLYGPKAIDAYMQEDVLGVSNWNYDAGHRRWVLGVPLTDMATGDTPGSFNHSTQQIIQPTNLLYVKPKESELGSAAPRFVSYPSPGYFPAQLNTPFWSLSYGGADFSAATVSMTDGQGNPVATTVESRRTGYAENAITWSVPPEVRAMTAPVDRTYHVTVSGIGGIEVDSHTWTVTLIDPNRITDPLEVTGPNHPIVSPGTGYAITPVSGCDRMETGFFLREELSWEETAESGTVGMVIDTSDPAYELFASVTQTAPGYASNYFTQGSRAFRLTFPRAYDPRLNSINDEIFELDRRILPGSGAAIRFQFRHGYMTSSTLFACESSADGGLTWQTVGSPINGPTNGQAEDAFEEVVFPLTESAEPIQIRFRLYRSDPQAGFYDHERYPNYATGVFVDEIGFDGCDWLKPAGIEETAPGTDVVDFSTETVELPVVAGQEWAICTRPVLGGQAFPWGPLKTVFPVGPLGISGPPAPPANGATYSFVPHPEADWHLLEVSRIVPAPWSAGAEDGDVHGFVDGTSSLHDLVSGRSGYYVDGSSAFRLGVGSGISEAWFEIDRAVMASGGSEVSFWLRRGWSSNQRLDLEISSDGGPWESVWSTTGKNLGDSAGESHLVDLSGHDGLHVRCRFVLRTTGTVNFNANNSGIWLDDIRMDGVVELLATESTLIESGSDQLVFSSATAGEEPVVGASYSLRLVPVVGGLPGEPGPSLLVSPVEAVLSDFELWLGEMVPPGIGGFEDIGPGGRLPNGVAYAFGIDPSAPNPPADRLLATINQFILERDLLSMKAGVVYGAEVSGDLQEWTSTGVTISHSDGVLRATVDRGSGATFLRWKISEE